ncbi:retrovirus-related pol polyprotein from transposon TNT 1-94 [Tanacetum coccineum]
MVAQGYRQKERIDYNKTFAPISRLEAMMIFLAYATYKDFMIYQMDVKIAFLNGKVDKALYGMKQGHRACYETLSKIPIQQKFIRGCDLDRKGPVNKRSFNPLNHANMSIYCPKSLLLSVLGNVPRKSKIKYKFDVLGSPDSIPTPSLNVPRKCKIKYKFDVLGSLNGLGDGVRRSK